MRDDPGKPDDQFPCMLHNPSGKIDQAKADGLHPLCNPGALKDQALHGGIEIVGKDHDPPPGGILSELPRRQLPSRKVLFHDGMGLFGLAASFMMPVDELASFPVHVRDDAEELVPGLIEGMV